MLHSLVSKKNDKVLFTGNDPYRHASTRVYSAVRDATKAEGLYRILQGHLMVKELWLR